MFDNGLKCCGAFRCAFGTYTLPPTPHVCSICGQWAPAQSRHAALDVPCVVLYVPNGHGTHSQMYACKRIAYEPGLQLTGVDARNPISHVAPYWKCSFCFKKFGYNVTTLASPSHVLELSFATTVVLAKYPRDKSELLAQEKPSQYSCVFATDGVPVDFGKHTVCSRIALVPHGHGTQNDALGNVEIQLSGHG